MAQGDPVDAVEVTELRVTLAGLVAEVGRMRGDLAPLGGLPAQLTAITQLHQERLTNLGQRVDRDVAELRADVAELRGWQTWAMRLVVGAVVMAVLGVVLVTGP